MKNEEYRLTRVYDLREWDEDVRGYRAIDEAQKSICDMCGRRHARVYEITHCADGRVFQVGGGCIRKNFGGWLPDAHERKAQEQDALRVAKGRAYQKKVEIARPIAAEVAALSVPPVVQVDTKHWPSRGIDMPIYGMVGSGVRIFGDASGILTETWTLACKRSWRREQIRQRVEKLFPPTSTEAQDVLARRRESCQRLVEDLIEGM